MNGYIKLVDYGVCKIMESSDTNKPTIVGAPEYLSPEIIVQKASNFTVDWWSFGIFLYEILFGKTPFYHKNQHSMFVKIIKDDFEFPTDPKISESCKDLIKKLLMKNPEHRLGAQGGTQEIKDHDWFKNTNFNFISEYKYTAHIIPEIDSENAAANFHYSVISLSN